MFPHFSRITFSRRAVNDGILTLLDLLFMGKFRYRVVGELAIRGVADENNRPLRSSGIRYFYDVIKCREMNILSGNEN